MGDCRRIATIRPRCLMLGFATKTQRGLSKNNYYTSNNLTSQQLSGVGGENRTHFHGFAIQCLSNWLHLHISGTASRNRTHIRRVEAYCIIHYTIAVLVRVARIELAWLASRDFKSLVSTYFTILAVTLLYLKQFCKSTVGTQSEIRTHRISPFERDDFSNLSIWALVGWVRIELTLNRLWVDCFTIKLSAHIWRKMWESNSLTVSLRWQISNLLHYRPAHLPNSGTQWENQTPNPAFVALCDIHFTNRV